MKLLLKFKGGPGSGNFGHKGREGQVGGSSGGGSSGSYAGEDSGIARVRFSDNGVTINGIKTRTSGMPRKGNKVYLGHEELGKPSVVNWSMASEEMFTVEGDTKMYNSWDILDDQAIIDMYNEAGYSFDNSIGDSN